MPTDYAREAAEEWIKPNEVSADPFLALIEPERLADAVNRLAEIIQRLAVEPARRAGAEEMRERAAAECEPWSGVDADDEPIDPVVMQIQVEIRALPIDPPREPEEEKHGES